MKKGGKSILQEYETIEDIIKRVSETFEFPLETAFKECGYDYEYVKNNYQEFDIENVNGEKIFKHGDKILFKETFDICYDETCGMPYSVMRYEKIN